MGGGGSAPTTITVDQCEEMDKMLKEEYGDDFATNREKFPITSQALGMLASTPVSYTHLTLPTILRV